MIKIISDKDSLLTFESVWTQLYDEDSSATPFQRFGYILNSIDFSLSKNDKIYIVAIKDAQANKWVAIFPLFLDTHRHLRFINWRHTDFCRPLINPQSLNYNLFKEFSEYILNNKDIQGLVFDNVELTNPLISALKSSFKYVITTDINYYSTVSIASKPTDIDSIDAFRAVPSKRKGKLRKIKNDKNNNCYLRIYNKTDGQPYPQKAINTLVNNMISDGIRVKEYFSDEMLVFWEKLYESDIISIAILYQNDIEKACSFLLVDKKKSEYIEWIILYNEKSWNVATCLWIEDYIYQSGDHSIFNFARGIYDYKLTNFHPDVKPLFCVKIAKTRWGHFKNIVSTAIHYSKPIVKSFLGR